MIERMLRAARLDVSVYEEVEHDQGATGQALLIIVLAAIAGGIGGLSEGLGGLVVRVIAAVLYWILLSGAAYLVGSRLLRTGATQATWGQVLRTVGFAYSPGVLSIFGFIPILGPILLLIISIWILVAAIIAIRQALDFTTLRAVGTGIIAWLIAVIILAPLTLLTDTA
ncbi:MAG TPA: YIP1 family protein [Dehalococcoidia bacterium]